MDAHRVFATLRDAGFAGVEMVAPQRRAAAIDAGLELVNLAAPGMTAGLNNRANHPNLLPAIRQTLSEAEADGIGQVIVFSGNKGNISDTDGKAATIDALTALAADAEKAEVTLTLEVLNPFDHPDYHASNSAFAFDIISAVNSPWVKVLYDQYHMQRVGEDPLKTITTHLPHIGHLHFAKSPSRTRIDTDEAKLIRKLRISGYAGYVGLEFVVPPNLDPVAEYAAAIRLI